MTALANRNAAALPTAVSPLAQRLGLSQEKLEVVRTQIAPGAPDDVIELYFEMCRVNGFDPFAKMLYCVGRNSKENVRGQWVDVKRWTYQTSIDGFRSIAEDTGEYDGQDEPAFEYDANGKLVSCTVRVYRKGMTRPIAATADWREYVQTKANGEPLSMWAKMPKTMLAKCAESLALRKAFPKRLHGIYTTDEMGQADNTASVAPSAPSVAVAGAIDAEFTETAAPTGVGATARTDELKAKLARGGTQNAASQPAGATEALPTDTDTVAEASDAPAATETREAKAEIDEIARVLGAAKAAADEIGLTPGARREIMAEVRGGKAGTVGLTLSEAIDYANAVESAARGKRSLEQRDADESTSDVVAGVTGQQPQTVIDRTPTGTALASQPVRDAITGECDRLGLSADDRSTLYVEACGKSTTITMTVDDASKVLAALSVLSAAHERL